MCRSSADGGRRCTGSSPTRTRALNTARKHLERARRALDAARNAADPDTLRAAQQRVDQAQRRLADTHAAHPLTPAADQGHHGPQTDHATTHHSPAWTDATTTIHHATGPITIGHHDQATTDDTTGTDRSRQGHDTPRTPAGATNTVIHHATGPITVGSGDQINTFGSVRRFTTTEGLDFHRPRRAASERGAGNGGDATPPPRPGTDDPHVRVVIDHHGPLHTGTGHQFTFGISNDPDDDGTVFGIRNPRR